MTENQEEALEGLAQLEGWQAPLHFGGGNGSHHGVTARRMADKLGWVEWCYRGHEPGEKLRNAERGSCLYRITAKGRQALANHKATKGLKP